MMVKVVMINDYGQVGDDDGQGGDDDGQGGDVLN